MKRLTYKPEQDERAYCPPNVKCNGKCNECEHIDKMMNKLAEYEDLEEQGLLIKLPCPLGTAHNVVFDMAIMKIIIIALIVGGCLVKLRN